MRITINNFDDLPINTIGMLIEHLQPEIFYYFHKRDSFNDIFILKDLTHIHYFVRKTKNGIAIDLHKISTDAK